MSGKRFVALLSVVVLVCLAAGCNDDSDNDGSITSVSGTFAGTWTGRVCGRGLTMILNQSGLTLSGSYALTDPDFGEPLNGSVSSGAPPASATLVGGGDRRFEISFSSYTSLSGGFFKGASRVCDVSATK